MILRSMNARSRSLIGVSLVTLPCLAACSLSDPSVAEFSSGFGSHMPGSAGTASEGGASGSNGGSESTGGDSAADGGASFGGTAGTGGAIDGTAGQRSSGQGGGGIGGGAAGTGAAGTGAGGTTGGGGGSGGSSAGNGAAGKGGSANNAGAGGSTPSIDPCDRSNWKVSASGSSLNPGYLYNPPIQAIDGDLMTRWSTGTDLVGGEWFLVDLGASAAHLSEMVINVTNSPDDYAVSYKLEVSRNGQSYTQVATGAGAVVTKIDFTDTSARYLKVTQLGSRSGWWSIDELTVTCQAN